MSPQFLQAVAWIVRVVATPEQWFDLLQVPASQHAAVLARIDPNDEAVDMLAGRRVLPYSGLEDAVLRYYYGDLEGRAFEECSTEERAAVAVVLAVRKARADLVERAVADALADGRSLEDVFAAAPRAEVLQ